MRTEERTIEAAIEEALSMKIGEFNQTMAELRRQMAAKGYSEAEIAEGYEASLQHFCDVLATEARRLARDLDGVLPYRSRSLH